MKIKFQLCGLGCTFECFRADDVRRDRTRVDAAQPEAGWDDGETHEGRVERKVVLVNAGLNVDRAMPRIAARRQNERFEEEETLELDTHRRDVSTAE